MLADTFNRMNPDMSQAATESWNRLRHRLAKMLKVSFSNIYKKIIVFKDKMVLQDFTICNSIPFTFRPKMIGHSSYAAIPISTHQYPSVSV